MKKQQRFTRSAIALAALVAFPLLSACSGNLDDLKNLDKTISNPSSNTATTTTSNNVVALADVINQYRVEKGLPRIPVSYSLTMVAEAHVNDLEKNNPAYGSCNLHSWSNQGNWSSCCYTSDHAQAQCMWNKPKEISNGLYASNGYEISAMGGVTPQDALEIWKGSPAHHDVILNKNIWLNFQWNAIGAAMSGRYSVVWFGTEADSVVSK